MAERLFFVSAPASDIDRLCRLAEERGALSVSAWKEDNDRGAVRVLVQSDDRQEILDALQGALSGSDNWRIAILPVEATLPALEEEEESAEDAAKNSGKKKEVETREELMSDATRSSRMSADFFLLVFLSTVVAAIGLIEDSVAVVIGAMVIAPLLGPNLAFALGAALGDRKLMGRAALTNLSGGAMILALSIAMGLGGLVDLESTELMARTNVGFDSIALALASGAAGAMSMTAGVSSAMVGVMVAVALLPPLATAGLMLGAGHGDLALGAGLLFAVNVVCVNLAAQAVLIYKGVTPRTWFERKNAKKAVRTNLTIWIVLLVSLAVLLALRSPT